LGFFRTVLATASNLSQKMPSIMEISSITRVSTSRLGQRNCWFEGTSQHKKVRTSVWQHLDLRRLFWSGRESTPAKAKSETKRQVENE
jgi:hypothetical protein